ncbi:hypothetical protein JMJ55_30220 [Belnapia sp. T6]|uniref:Glucosyl transferase GtrII n=1 Tax=Belnapia mucosa TaxID=2804532 RepID=A0ABS1VD22_9PROT|nr:hypothetical protein [Belnapia mucosa]MBL6459584.1 hypothetical protein [Belnapia mucosa]
MIDYPNHLARYFAVAHYGDLPALQEFYRVEWHPIANIGIDVVVQAIHNATSLPTERISQALVGTLSVLLIPAVLSLNRALFGVWSYWPLASALLVFNYVLLYGFTNYVGGLTLAIFLAAAWAALHGRSLAVLLLAFALSAAALFFFHLYAFAIYGLFWLCHAAWSLWMRQGTIKPLVIRHAVAALQFVPAVLVLVLFSPTSRNIGLDHIQPAMARDKLMGLHSVFDIGVPSVTLATFGVFGTAVLAGLASRRLVFSPLGAVVVSALTVAFLAMPFGLLGAAFADYRLPVAITAVAIAATRWRALPGRAAFVLSAAFTALVVVRVAVMTSEWAQSNRRYTAIMRLMSAMEPGRRLLTIIAAEDISTPFLRRPPIDHASALAVIARQSFVPTLFAEPEKQPISFTPAVASLAQILLPIAPLYGQPDSFATSAGPPGYRLAPTAWLYRSPDPLSLSSVAYYDYVLVFARTPLRRELPAHLERIGDATVADLTLLAVRRDNVGPEGKGHR